MKPQTISVTEFKAKCLSLLDDIGKRGGSITVTKRGRPLAVVSPARRLTWKSPEGMWEGKLSVPDDIVERDTSHLWEALCSAPGTKK
jgi:prevent-host-death family protein